MRKIFNCIMDIGEQMLICGAEVHRVEDSINRMCAAFGAERSDVFIITSSMVVTVYMPDESVYTQTRRIKGIGTDIEKLHGLNRLSREICSEKLTPEQIRSEFREILNLRSYPLWVECIAYMAVAAAFAVFFGGGLSDAAVALVIGCIVRFIVLIADKASMNKIFTKFLCSFAVSSLALVGMRLGFIDSIDKAVIGNIMLLIPGVGLTNGLRDLFAGDSIAGLLRLIEAVLTALAIAAGYFLFVVTMGGALK